VNGPRHQFFSGSGLAHDQNRGMTLADLSDHLKEPMHRCRLTDKPIAGMFVGRRAREDRVVFHFFFDFLLGVR
jgi:hypothetical protein